MKSFNPQKGILPCLRLFNACAPWARSFVILFPSMWFLYLPFFPMLILWCVIFASVLCLRRWNIRYRFYSISFSLPVLSLFLSILTICFCAAFIRSFYFHCFSRLAYVTFFPFGFIVNVTFVPGCRVYSRARVVLRFVSIEHSTGAPWPVPAPVSCAALLTCRSSFCLRVWLFRPPEQNENTKTQAWNRIIKH